MPLTRYFTDYHHYSPLLAPYRLCEKNLFSQFSFSQFWQCVISIPPILDVDRAVLRVVLALLL